MRLLREPASPFLGHDRICLGDGFIDWDHVRNRMPKRKLAKRRTSIEEHLACPYCKGELVLWVELGKGRRRGIRSSPRSREG